MLYYVKGERSFFILQPIIDHIDITVEDLTRAEKFYDRLLPQKTERIKT